MMRRGFWTETVQHERANGNTTPIPGCTVTGADTTTARDETGVTVRREVTVMVPPEYGNPITPDDRLVIRGEAWTPTDYLLPEVSAFTGTRGHLVVPVKRAGGNTM